MRGLVHDTLRLILSIGGIILVLVLAGKLVGVYLHNQQMDVAKKTLDSLVGKSLLIVESQTAQIPLVGPCGKTAGGPLQTVRKILGEKCSDQWSLMGWGTDLPPSQRPGRCYLESCICICQGNTPDSCQDLSKGVCTDVPGITGIFVTPSGKDVTGYIPGDGGTGGVSVPLGKDLGILFPSNYIELKVTRTGTTLTFECTTCTS